MLAVLALTAFMSDAGAQTRRSSEVDRSARSAARRPSNTVKTDPSRTAPSKATQAIVPNVKPDRNDDIKPGNQNKPVQITRPVPQKPQGNNQAARPGIRPDSGPGNNPAKPGMKPDMKPGKNPGMKPGHKPEPARVHPRERDFMRWDSPSYWWSKNDHYYGYRVRVLPSRARRHVYNGVTYYCYNDIWYRPYKGYYMVCRPPYGLALAADIISQIAWAAVKINRSVLAQNDVPRDTDYFYYDGVFYSRDYSGQYRVAAPPAGALVESLPEDFDIVTLRDGNEYYKVDDTIYKVAIVDGKPYFEVVGQIEY